MNEIEIKTKESLDIDNPQIGVYKNVPDSIYFEVKAVNNSTLNTIWNSTPAHLKWEKENPDEVNKLTPPKELGSLVHALLLQPDREEKDLMIIPSGGKGTKKFKEQLQKTFSNVNLDGLNWGDANKKIRDAYPDKIIAGDDQVVHVKEMIKQAKYYDRVFGGRKLEKVLRSGLAEVVCIWVDEDTGLVCKCKFDWINFELKIGIDVKTTADASPKKFSYSISDYGYHRGLVFYESGAKANGLDLVTAIFALETSPPFVPAWYEFQFEYDSDATGDEYAIAEDELRSLLWRYKICTEMDKWPPYLNMRGQNVMPIILKYDHYKRYRENPFKPDDLGEMLTKNEKTDE